MFPLVIYKKDEKQYFQYNFTSGETASGQDEMFLLMSW